METCGGAERRERNRTKMTRGQASKVGKEELEQRKKKREFEEKRDERKRGKMKGREDQMLIRNQDKLEDDKSIWSMECGDDKIIT